MFSLYLVPFQLINIEYAFTGIWNGCAICIYSLKKVTSCYQNQIKSKTHLYSAIRRKRIRGAGVMNLCYFVCIVRFHIL